MTKCPICKGHFRLTFNVDYDEPPERLSECKNCGFTEYYFYYEGYTTCIRSCKFDEENQSYVNVELCIIHNDNQFVDREEYKAALNEQLEEFGLTVDDLISALKEKTSFLENKAKIKKEKEMNDNVRWANEDYTQEELLKINEFLLKEVMKAKVLEKEEVVINLKLQQQEGLFSNISFEIDEKKAAEYEAKKEAAQSTHAISISAPMFASNSCFKCYTRIFGLSKENKILFGKSYETIKEHLSIEKCSTILITGCPNCSRSYVD